jgi:hypothetical protein
MLSINRVVMYRVFALIPTKDMGGKRYEPTGGCEGGCGPGDEEDN